MNIFFARNLKSGKHHTPPPTPTNADRLREYRQAAPVVLANGKRWKWHRTN